MNLPPPEKLDELHKKIVSLRTEVEDIIGQAPVPKPKFFKAMSFDRWLGYSFGVWAGWKSAADMNASQLAVGILISIATVEILARLLSTTFKYFTRKEVK